MFEIKKINFNKLFFTIITSFLLLFTITLYMFNMVDKRSDQMLHHKTTLVKGIYTIKYHLASVHLWFTQIASGDDLGAKEKIIKNFSQMKNSLTELYEIESSDAEIHRSKVRDEEFILKSIEDIKKSVDSFEKLTFIYLDNKILLKEFNHINYDADYEILIDKLEVFDDIIKETYLNLVQEQKKYKRNVYLSIMLLILLTIIFTFYIFKNEKEKITQIRKKEEYIAEQYKLAAMGEMIDAIAHQWKSPLGIIRMHADYTQISIELKEANYEDIHRDMNTVMVQIDHLINTINEFRGFFRPNTQVEIIPLKNIIDSTMILVKDELLRYQIKTQINCDENIKIEINQNELKHVFINLIQNSKDAFEEKKIKKREITFDAKKIKDKVILKIYDNAGGIDENILEKIFISHFTTKIETKGTGIGLYLSKQIVEKHGASIGVKNYKAGICFTITFKSLK